MSEKDLNALLIRHYKPLSFFSKMIVAETLLLFFSGLSLKNQIMIDISGILDLIAMANIVKWRPEHVH
jgi:hypothetical protein